MEKKTFINPSVGVIKLETSALICGSGGSTGQIEKGGSGQEPTKGSDGNYYGDARAAGAGINVEALDF